MSETLRTIADEIFDRHNPYPGDGLRNHCLRLEDFCLLHAQRTGDTVDAELVHLAAMLHDLGLMERPRPGVDYLHRTVELAHRELADLDLSGDQWAALDECLLYNHALRPPRPLRPIAARFNDAVHTEHSYGLRRRGLDRGTVRRVFGRHPRDNFNTVLADFFWKTGVFEPTTIPRLFFPR
jgi:hypothetical protein